MMQKKDITAIKFGLLSPDEIRQMSVAKIITPDTYDEDGVPIENGLMDPRLGTIDPARRCKTCGGSVSECPGHFGHIELARPMIAIGFTKEIHTALKVTCHACGKFKLPPDVKEKYLKQIKTTLEEDEYFDLLLVKKAIKEAERAKTCPYCGTEQHKIKLEKPTSFFQIIEEEDRKVEEKIDNVEIQERLSKIPDEDCYLMGINPKSARPEWMVLTVLPVPPITVRPSITLENGIRSEDDLTHKLVDIIRINQRVIDDMEAGAPTVMIMDLAELLQYHVTTYFNNEVSGIPVARHRSGRPLRTLSQRLKGKEGRFRGNLSGKRVNFSARTVISPDPALSINEVGVPLEIAKILTVPEKVTEYNIEDMKELVMRGSDEHPGANYIQRPDGGRIALKYAKDRAAKAENLQLGYIVERHLRDGDIVLFNRQPSLHRMSILAHYVRVMPYRTFRLNLAVCRPYNADFDGDEMNLHVPQSEEARAEAELLMLVQQHISSPRYGGSIIGFVQDHITAAYYLTKSGTYFNKEEVSRLLSFANFEDLPEPDKVDDNGQPLWSGKTIFSITLPKGLNYFKKNKLCKCEDPESCTHDGFVIIEDGVLKSGAIDKTIIGAEQMDSIIQTIYLNFGAATARKFIDDLNKILLWYISTRGFSLGLDEVELPYEAKQKIQDLIEKMLEDTRRSIESYLKGELEKQPGKTLEETLEQRIMKILGQLRENAAEVALEYLAQDNSIAIMAKIGARGSSFNIGQMTALLGQQSIRGARMTRGYKERTLPHFKPNEQSVASKGFVQSNFRDGLNPLEYFFHAAGGREGLIDTAVRTSQSGYTQRKLINSLQDIRLEYDFTVRNSQKGIVQYRFGEDGIDPMKTSNGAPVDVDKIIEEVLSEVETK